MSYFLHQGLALEDLAKDFTCLRRAQIHGTSATVVLLGKKTYQSDWVEWEIRKSLEKGKPNGILAIRLEPSVPLPQDSPVGVALHEAGAEIIDWDSSQFADAIERACLATGRANAFRRVANRASGSRSCARKKTSGGCILETQMWGRIRLCAHESSNLGPSVCRR